MSLLTDSDVLSAADLTGIEPEVADVSSEEGIPLEGDNGVIRQAWEEVGDSLNAFNQTFDGGFTYFPATLLRANMGMNRPRFRLNQVVTSSLTGSKRSALVRWMQFKALEAFYRAASSRKEVDRYQKKFDTYADESKKAWRRFQAMGLPVVLSPLPCPGAVHEIGAGVFDGGAVTAVSGGAWTDQALFDVAITWVDQSAYQSPAARGNAESGPSAIQSVQVGSGEKIQVSIAGLVPPDPSRYQLGVSEGVYTCRTATGWNVYVGPAGGTLLLQTMVPIPLSQSTALIDPASMYAVAPPLPFGQFPDYHMPMQRMLVRG